MKLLALDIETEPNLVYTFNLFKTTIGINQIVRPGQMMCFAAQQIDPINDSVGDMMFYSNWNDGHTAMVEALWDLLNETDAVLTYNGDSFDVKVINSEFLAGDMTPPAPYQSIDLYKINAKHFRFPSKKLDYLSRVLLEDRKVSTGGFDLWRGCMEGDPGSLALMEKYNRRDVELLSELYFAMRPWISTHPNMNLYVNDSDDAGYRCPTCTSDKLTKQGRRYTKTGSYQRYRCSSCGAWSSGGRSVQTSFLRTV